MRSTFHEQEIGFGRHPHYKAFRGLLAGYDRHPPLNIFGRANTPQMEHSFNRRGRGLRLLTGQDQALRRINSEINVMIC